MGFPESYCVYFDFFCYNVCIDRERMDRVLNIKASKLLRKEVCEHEV